MKQDAWSPIQYDMFGKEREKPFFDLLEMIQPSPDMSIVDLGCGTGRLTQILHQKLKAKATLGIDASESMLQESSKINVPGLSFKLEKIEDFHPEEKFDLIFSNAALHWIPFHWELIPKFRQFLSEKGQMAIQIPANFNTLAYRIAQETAPLTDDVPDVLLTEEYSKIVFKSGFRVQNVRMQIYPLQFESVEGFIEWVKGAYLTYYKSRLSDAEYVNFLNDYRKRMLETFGDEKPFFIPFKRILIWARVCY